MGSSTAECERFAMIVAEHCREELVVLLLAPWSGANGPLPPGILVPELSGSNAALDAEAMARGVANKATVLVPCTFEHPEEEAAAWRLLPRFTACENLCVLIGHLLPPGVKPGREENELIMRRHEAMLATGVDDVLLNLKPEPEALKRSIGLARSIWQLNVRRMQLMLEAEEEPVSKEDMQNLQSQHRRLLWDSIPKALMPNFRLVDRTLAETSNSVDKYKFVRRFETVAGTVLHATDDENTNVAIKVIDKNTVCTPGELEGIYRECRFLSDMIRHPNVAKCLNMLHSPTRVYLVFAFAGNENLVQALSALPGNRFDADVALNCFEQFGGALAHCHSKDVTHRHVCMEHVVLQRLPGSDKFQCTLVDFHSAMVSRGDSTSRTLCGTLPCIAPEVAMGAAYVPWRADCWSAGVVLLEMSGGLSTMTRAVPFETDTEPREAAGAIQEYFGQPGSHARALALIGAVDHQGIATYAETLMQPDPQMRPRFADLLPPQE